MAASSSTKLLFLNCDSLVDLKKISEKLLAFDTHSAIESRIDYFKLREMEEKTDEILKTEGNKPNLAIFVVHAGESRLSINEPYAGIGYAKIYNALKAVTEDKVFVVIAHDNYYEDDDKAQLLSTWARAKVSSQFNQEHIDGPKGYIFSWKDCPQPCHSRKILEYLQNNFEHNTKLENLQVPEISSGDDMVQDVSEKAADDGKKITPLGNREFDMLDDFDIYKEDKVSCKMQNHTTELIDSAIEDYKRSGWKVVGAQVFDNQGKRCKLLEDMYQLPKATIPSYLTDGSHNITTEGDNKGTILFVNNKGMHYTVERVKINPCPKCSTAPFSATGGSDMRDMKRSEPKTVVNVANAQFVDESTKQALEEYQRAEQKSGENEILDIYAVSPGTQITDELFRDCFTESTKRSSKQKERVNSIDEFNQDVRFIVCIRKKDGYEILEKKIDSIKEKPKKFGKVLGFLSQFK